MSSAKRRPEDSADGCRALAKSDCEQAAEVPSGHMRARFERSAAAWTTRAGLLERIEASFVARAASLERERIGGSHDNG